MRCRPLVLTTLVICLGAAATHAAPDPPAAPVAPVPAGWAPRGRTLFAPVVHLAAPGPRRAARAVEVLDRHLGFQRKISFHPEYDDALMQVIDELPPRQSTLIRAAALYGHASIPWQTRADATHEIAVAGAPRAADYYYHLTTAPRPPDTPGHFAGRFALRPAEGAHASTPSSVVGTLGGELVLDTYGLDAMVDVVAAILTQTYGTLRPPWDTAPGVFNHHDRAALDRVHREMPQFAAKLDEYLQFHNVLDEFDSPAGPIVVYNLDAEVRQDALRKYPRLADFYRAVAGAVTAESTLLDATGHHWQRNGFDRGRIRTTFMVRNGQLTPFTPAFEPAGESVALNTIDLGTYRTRAAVRVRSLGMTFGLTNLGVATMYRREGGTVIFGSRMTAVPELIAPPGLNQAIRLVAGRFLQVLATGHGGLGVEVRSARQPDGMVRVNASAEAELQHAPALGFLARIGDAFAGKHDAEVRAQERALAEEFFDAFVADYTAARAAILALDAPPDSGIGDRSPF